MKGVDLKRAMLDPGSLMNIISLSVLDAIGLPLDIITMQPIQGPSFRGNRTYTMGFLNLDLTIGPIQAAHKFHMIDFQTTYHLLLRRPWIHLHKTVPSTDHKCLKSIWKGKRVHVNAIESPFQEDEAHFSEVAYFDELTKDG